MKFLSFALHVGLGSAFVTTDGNTPWDPKREGISKRGAHRDHNGRDNEPININLKSWKPNNREEQWYGSIIVGTPPQTL